MAGFGRFLDLAIGLAANTLTLNCVSMMGTTARAVGCVPLDGDSSSFCCPSTGCLLLRVAGDRLKIELLCRCFGWWYRCSRPSRLVLLKSVPLVCHVRSVVVRGCHVAVLRALVVGGRLMGPLFGRRLGR